MIIRPHLHGLEQAAAAVRISSRQLTGRVRAGFVSNLAYGFMPDLLSALKRAAPGIGVELTELPAPEQLRSLRERRLDIGLAILPIADPALKRRLLFREPLVAVLPAGHPLATLTDIPLRTLSRESFVICPRYRSTGFHETILDFCRAAGFEPRVNHEASSTTMVTELVAAGLGVALTPESAISPAHPGVVYRPLSESKLPLEIAAVWLEESMTPALRLFIDQAVQLAAGRRERSIPVPPQNVA